MAAEVSGSENTDDDVGARHGLRAAPAEGESPTARRARGQWIVVRAWVRSRERCADQGRVKASPDHVECEIVIFDNVLQLMC